MSDTSETEAVPRLQYGDRTFSFPWRDVCDPLTAAERADLFASIKADGVLDPIMIDEFDNVIDGEHRLTIAEELAIPLHDVPFCLKADLTMRKKRRMVGDLNVCRRQMTAEQRIATMKRTRERIVQLKSEGKTYKDIREETGASQGTIVRALNENKQRPPLATTNENTPQKHGETTGVPRGTPENESRKVAVPMPQKVVGRDGKTYPANRPSPPPADVHRDECNCPIPEFLLLTFETRKKLKSIRLQMAKLFTEVDELSKLPGGQRIRLGDFEAKVESAKGILKSSSPHVVCPECQGHGCDKLCDGLGWLSERQYPTLSVTQKEFCERFQAQEEVSA